MEPVFVVGPRRGGRARVGRAAAARRPTHYVVEEYLPLSHAPVWHDGRLESRALMLRVFLARRRPRRLPRDAGRAVAHRRRAIGTIVSSQRGGSSKDTWVLSDAPVDAVVAAAGPLRAARTSARATRTCRAARPSTCSGWAATPSAARTARGCCAPCSSRLTDADALARASSRVVSARLRSARVCSTRPTRGRRDVGDRPPTLELAALLADLFDRADASQPRVQRRADRARRRRRARSPVVRQLAPAQPAARSCSRATSPAPLDLDDALDADRPASSCRSSPSAASRWRT